VGGGDLHVGILRMLHAEAVSVRGALEIPLQVVRETQVIVDVRLQRAGRDVACVGLSVRLHFVGSRDHQRCRPCQVRYRVVELADGDVPVTAMAIQARVLWMVCDRGRVDRDGVAKARQVRGAASHPDGRFYARRVLLELYPGRREIRFEAGPDVGCDRRRVERFAEKRGRLRFRAILRGAEAQKEEGEREVRHRAEHTMNSHHASFHR
jgi:hypothetical protein